jgi:hypothetical protein
MNGIFLVLAHIMIVESGGVKVGIHPDGCSYGLFGLTEVACVEVGEPFPPETPRDELRTAKAYLEKVNERFKCPNYWEAAGFYHGGGKERREEYCKKLHAVDESFATNTFNKIFRREADAADVVVWDIHETLLEGVDPIDGPDQSVIAKLENRVLQLADAIKELKAKKY